MSFERPRFTVHRHATAPIIAAWLAGEDIPIARNEFGDPLHRLCNHGADSWCRHCTERPYDLGED